MPTPPPLAPDSPLRSSLLAPSAQGVLGADGDAGRRKILPVVNPQTGGTVDLSSPLPAPPRRREPIPIVDPKSGTKVSAPAAPLPKPRGPVAIIDPASGERVRVPLTPPELRALPSAPEPAGSAAPLLKFRSPVPIIDPASGQQIIPAAAKGPGEGGSGQLPKPAHAPPTDRGQKTSKAIPIVAPAQKALERQRALAEVAPLLPPAALEAAMAVMGGVGSESPRGSSEASTPGAAPTLTDPQGLAWLPPVAGAEDPWACGAAVPLFRPPPTPAPPPLPRSASAPVLTRSAPAPRPALPPSLPCSRPSSPPPRPAPSALLDVASSSSSPSTFPTPLPAFPVPPTPTLPLPSPSGKPVYTEHLLRLLRDLAAPAPAALQGDLLAEIYVPDAEGYARRAQGLWGPAGRPVTRVPFGPGGGAGGGGFSNVPAAWGRDSFATSSPTSLLMSNSFIQDFRQAMGTKVGAVLPAPGLHPPPSAIQLQHRAPLPFTRPRGLSAEDTLLKRIVGILNKVTPEKYDTLVCKLYEGLDAAAELITAELLDKIIAQVHERALEQPTYSDMYAQLCMDTCLRIQAKPSHDRSVLDSFRSGLVNMCQERFMLGVDKPPLEIPPGLPPEDVEELLGRELQFRKSSKGNIRFIGELFNRGLLSERIMHRVIKRLLLDTDHGDPQHQDGLEVLCTLLATAGRQLDRPEAQKYMAHYFQALADISKRHKSARIKFLLLDVLDLRQNGWVKRKKEIKAQKLEDLQRSLAQPQDRPHPTPAPTITRPPAPAPLLRRAEPLPPPVFGTALPKARRPVQPREGALKAVTAPNAQCFRPASAFHQPAVPRAPSPSEPPEVLAPEVAEPVSGPDSEQQAPPSPPATPTSATAAAPGVGPSPPAPEEAPLSARADPSPLGELVLVRAEERLERKMGVILEEWEQCGHSEETALLFLEEIEAAEHAAFLCSGVKYAASANKFEKQRLQLVLLTHVLLQKGAVTRTEVLTALVSAVSLMLDIELWVDVPGLWRNVSQVLVELLIRDAFGFADLPLLFVPFAPPPHGRAGRQLLRCLGDRMAEQGCHGLFDAEVAASLLQLLGEAPAPALDGVEDLLRHLQ